MSTHETAAKLAKHSQAVHEQLVAKRSAGDLYFEPDPTDLHAAELTIDRETIGWGNTSHGSVTLLFVDEETAWAAACERIKNFYKESHFATEGRIHDGVMKQIADGKLQSAAEMFSQGGYLIWFKVKTVEIRSTAKPHEISMPPEAPEAAGSNGGNASAKETP